MKVKELKSKFEKYPGIYDIQENYNCTGYATGILIYQYNPDKKNPKKIKRYFIKLYKTPPDIHNGKIKELENYFDIKLI
jgi:hypothetical protein